MKKANGRLHLRLFGAFVCCNGTAQNVLSRGVVVRVFRDALDHCAAPQKRGEAISRDGSSDLSVGCLELREGVEWIEKPTQSPVEISSNRVHTFFKHHRADRCAMTSLC